MTSVKQRLSVVLEECDSDHLYPGHVDDLHVFVPLRHVLRLVHLQPELDDLGGRHVPGSEGEVVQDRAVGDRLQHGLVEDEGQQLVAHPVLPGAQLGLAAVEEGGSEGEDGEGLPNVIESVKWHGPVRLTAQLHHQPVVGEVGDVVARLPDGQL